MSDQPQIGAKIVLSGADEVNAVYQRMATNGEQAFNRVDNAAAKAGASVREGARQAGVATQAAVAQAQQSTSGLSSFLTGIRSFAGAVVTEVERIAAAAAIAGAGLTVAFAAGYNALGNFAEANARETVAWVAMADAAGVSVEALSRYEYMAGVASGSSDQVASSLKHVNDLLIRFRENPADEAAARPFIQLGLGSDLLKGKLRNAEDVLKAVETQFRLIPDAALRSKAAYDLFGAGAKELLPVFTKNKDDLEALRREAEKLGETKRSDLDLEKTTKLLEDKNRLKIAIDSLKDALGSAFFPVLVEGAGKTAALINDNKEKIEGWIQTAADTFKSIRDDIGTLFSTPLESKRLDVTVDGKSIDLTKERLKELLEAAKTTQAGVAGAAAGAEGDDDEDAPAKPGGAARSSPRFRVGQPFTDDVQKPDPAAGPGRSNPKFRFGYPMPKEEDDGAPEKAAKQRAANLDSISLSELRKYVAFAHAKIMVDKEANQSYILLQGQRVDITRANAQVILKGLADDVQKQINLQTSGATSQVKFANEWLRSLYGPAQELRRLGLDLWDAISGKGLGDRSVIIQKLSIAWKAATGYIVQFRDAVLGVFGLTVADIPTMTQLWDGLLAAFASFKAGLYGQTPKDMPWAASLGRGVAYAGGVLKDLWTVVTSVIGFVAPYVASGLHMVADAFRAAADYIKGNPIADDNTFAWVQQYIPQVEAGFKKIEKIVVDAVKAVRDKLYEWFKDVTLDDVIGVFSKGFAIIGALGGILYLVLTKVFDGIYSKASSLYGPLDKIAKVFGYQSGADLLLKMMVGHFILMSPPVQFILSLLGAMLYKILPALLVGVLGLYGAWFLLRGIIATVLQLMLRVVLGLVATFGGIPVAIGAALLAAAVLAYKYSDQIKAAFSAAADWVIDKWQKVTGFIGGVYEAVKKKLGFGGGDKPGDAAPAEAADGATPLKTSIPAKMTASPAEPFRTAVDGEGAPEAPGAAPKPGSWGDTLKRMLEGLETVRKEITAPDKAEPGQAPADGTDPAQAPASWGDSMKKLLEGLQTFQQGIQQQTPFTGAPPVVPEGKGTGGLTPMTFEIDPNDTRVWATPAGAENLISQLQQAGLTVSTPRPRAQ